MYLKDHLDQKNFHHAYLIEGEKEEIIPEILKFINGIGINTSGNPDFCEIVLDSFKINEALDLREMGTQKGFTEKKKIFIIGANSFSLDAQGVLLKMFEEPIENTHFFIIVPDKNVLLKTLVSRFYLIDSKSILIEGYKEAEKFIAMPLFNRISFIKELLLEEDDFEEEIIPQNSTRAKALKFLNALEAVLHQKLTISKTAFDTRFFNQIFTAREYLRLPGSSAKSLMEGVALSIPVFSL